MIFLFDSPGITLGNAGGKGLNLARLCQAGLPVPPGFIIPTPAYQAYLQANSLEAVIQPAITTSDAQDPDALEAASAAIRAAFARGTVPPSLAEEILQGYTSLGAGAVAVRSSATAEDLPEMSFAGQQDTYLNIQGSAALLQAVIACWGSLWTARAISYRARNRLAPADLSLAVIVQQMVPAQSSGVLFTANPLSGLRSETVIDATLGLGEALVSGQVEPDQYTVQSQSNKITHKHIGAKATQTRIDSHGGVRSEQVDSHDVQALADDRILELARLGQHVAALFGEPQDIEWAWADGKLYLLQARPITSLFPTPQGMPADPLRVLFSFGAVQGMLDPVTPFGQDFLRRIFTVGSHLFAIPVTLETQTVMFTAGERLWINITTPLRNTFGRKIIRPVLNMGDPAAVEALNAIWDDPRLQPQRRGIRFHARTQIARFLVPVLGNVLLNLISPDQRREYIVNRGERVLQVVRERCAALQGDRRARLTQLTQLVPDLLNQYLPRTFRLFISGIAAGMVSLNVLSTASQHAGPGTQDGQKVGWSDLILKVAGGIPNNPTTEMDLALWQTAQLIKKDPLSWDVFQQAGIPELTARYQARTLPDAAQGAVDQFLEKYGGRGLAEIDAGRARWAEEPAHIFDALTGYLQIEDANRAPDAVFKRSAAAAAAAIDQLVSSVEKGPRGWFKMRQIRFAARRARALLGVRENPKFFAVRFLAIFRWELLKLGSEFAQAGELDQADDLVYLSLNEIRAFAAGEPNDWPGLIAKRRLDYQRELQRRQIPRVLLSDGQAFYEGISAPGDAATMLTGSPVSSGSVEGNVRVVLDPRHAGLLPGEILVCPGTDPAWTPLFLTAGGLVMEVGGLMTHGSVVAREYGIPAVVGVHQATTRLKTGQRIRVDGNSGKIVILSD